MKYLAFIFLFFLSVSSFADCTLAVTVNGAITAATNDYLARAEKEVTVKNCQSLLVRINTPGGDLQSTRKIVERILASKFPYLCLITPSGGHAGSAGAIILQACHINGGVEATQLGAATPILSGGTPLPEDLRNKLINDTVGWSQSLAQLRGRNADFAKAIVTEAKVNSTEQAVKVKAMDFLVSDENQFLQQAGARTTQIQNLKDQKVLTGPLVEFPPDFRYRVLEFISDPEFVYLLFMISIALLYFELTHPGFGAPGVLGAMGLILALIAFNKLEVQWGGLALVVVGIGFLVAEIFLPSFGILGIGGLISLVVGSLFLFDPAVSGYTLPLSLIISTTLVFAVFFFGLGFMALQTFRRKRKDWDSEIIGHKALVKNLRDEFSGQIEVLGELWNFESSEAVKLGDTVEVSERQGLILKVKKHQEA